MTVALCHFLSNNIYMRSHCSESICIADQLNNVSSLHFNVCLNLNVRNDVHMRTVTLLHI